MATKGRRTASSRIREKLDHPVIDSDGHLREFQPLFLDYVRKVCGPDLFRRYRDGFKGSALGFEPRGGDLYGVMQDPRDPKRRDWRTPRGVWFGSPMQNVLNAATPFLPRLLHRRMDDMGLDYTILYPGLGLALPHQQDAEIRQGTIRALNTYFSETTRDHADRMTAAAVIPMHTPAEAIAELDHAVKVLGAKVIMVPPGVLRPIPALHRQSPGAFPDASWIDNFGLDSAHDYDPVWQRCLDLKVAVTCHGGMVPNVMWNGRSLSNFNFNHIGNMALQQHGFCKSIFMHGVTRRFPTLQFAFMECGVGWACMLYADLIGHWDKRNLAALPQFDPANLDGKRYVELLREFGGPFMDGLLDRPETFLPRPLRVTDPVLLDEWRMLDIRRKQDFKPLFTDNFHFGCEADDPITAWGFDTRRNPYGARLKAMLGSDIGHFDLPDMTAVLEEAYELVEHELLDADEFRDFAFTNAARMHLKMNPDFFKGTRVEAAAASLAPRRRAAGAVRNSR